MPKPCVALLCVIKLSPLSFYTVSCFYMCLHILTLYKHSCEARPLGSSSLQIFVCMRWSTLVLLPVLLSCGPPSRCLGSLKQFGKKMSLSMLWPLTAANFKNYPASDQNFSPSLRHTTNIHHLFGLFCDQLLTRDVFWKDLSIVSVSCSVIVRRRLHLCKSYARETPA